MIDSIPPIVLVLVGAMLGALLSGLAMTLMGSADNESKLKEADAEAQFIAAKALFWPPKSRFMWIWEEARKKTKNSQQAAHVASIVFDQLAKADTMRCQVEAHEELPSPGSQIECYPTHADCPRCGKKKVYGQDLCVVCDIEIRATA